MDICIITETHTQTRKLHAVSVFVSYPPFFDSIFRQTNTPFNQNRQYPTPFTFSFYTITETPDFCVKVYFCLIVRFFPLSPSYQRHPKTKKLGSTTHRDEPHQALKTLILSHSSILSPASTKNPMALLFYRRLCRCYTLMTFTPLYPIYPTQFDIRQTGFDKLRSYRQNPYFSVRRNRIRAALKAVPTHAPRPYLMRSAWYCSLFPPYRQWF